jgi:hypothetical protein
VNVGVSWQLLGNFPGFCAQVAYADMLRAGSGKIINIDSMMSLFGAPYAAPCAGYRPGSA